MRLSSILRLEYIIACCLVNAKSYSVSTLRKTARQKVRNCNCEKSIRFHSCLIVIGTTHNVSDQARTESKLASKSSENLNTLASTLDASTSLVCLAIALSVSLAAALLGDDDSWYWRTL